MGSYRSCFIKRLRRDGEYMTLTRSAIVQGFLDLYGGEASYLEIGVSNGKTFQAVEAAEKIGVDPRFDFDRSSIEDGEIRLFESTSPDSPISA
jgi:hypothetical protein